MIYRLMISIYFALYQWEYIISWEGEGEGEGEGDLCVGETLSPKI